MPSHFCLRCHRPLSLPESVERGIGPICMKKMFKPINQLSMFHADFTYEVIQHPVLGTIFLIEDLDKGNMSVTNDIEHVLSEVLADEGIEITDVMLKIHPVRFTYKDSGGTWDEVQLSSRGIHYISHGGATRYEQVIDRWLIQMSKE